MSEKTFKKTPPLFTERTEAHEISYYPLAFKERQTLQFEVRKTYETKDGKMYTTGKHSSWEIPLMLGALSKAHQTIKKYEKDPDIYLQTSKKQEIEDDDIPF